MAGKVWGTVNIAQNNLSEGKDSGHGMDALAVRDPFEAG